ncbi:MAG TPA: SH3 domain-containing protein [Thermoanaerobaculia bacterium]
MKRFVVVVVLLAACSAPPPPAPSPQPAEMQAPAAEKAIGTVRVTATTLNVRREPAASAEVIGQVRKGERLALLVAGDQWDRVQLANGAIGFVSVDHVLREGRARRGCPADSDFQFTKTPTPSFSDNGNAHGIVTVDASVDTHGNVTATKIVTNTTGDQSLGVLAEREIRDAKFSPPIRNCVAKAFIFTYKRSF